MQNILKRLEITEKSGFIQINFIDKHIQKYYSGTGWVWKDYKNILLLEHPREEEWLYSTELIGIFNGLLAQYPNGKVASCDLDCWSLEKGLGKSYGFFEEDFLKGPWELEEFVKAFGLLVNHWPNEIFIVEKLKLTVIKGKAKRKQRKRTHIPKGMKHEVFKRDNWTCVECGARKEDGAILHVDHIIPVSKGGTDELSNLQTLCKDCNLNKSDVYQKNNSS